MTENPSPPPRQTRTPRRASLLGRISTRAEAERMIKDCTLAYYLLAAVLLIIAIFAQTNIWLDALLYAALAFWLQRFQSLIAAILLLLAAILVFVATMLNWPGATVQGRNALLGVFMIWTSARAVEATLKLPKLAEAEVASDSL